MLAMSAIGTQRTLLTDLKVRSWHETDSLMHRKVYFEREADIE
ncbi:hypothetical protein [Citrobacter europaeus]|nr:hypothetical protein [Citrobacter europaeus]